MKNILLLARSAITGGALKEMERLRDHAAAHPGVARAVFAFAEEGTPSLRAALDQLIADGATTVLIMPMLVPLEPSFITGLRKALQRWQAASTGLWPEIAIAAPPAVRPEMKDVLAATIDAEPSPVDRVETAPPAEGSVVPPQGRRILVCQGAPCIRAGADFIWGHLRNEQRRLNLRTTGKGTMSAKTSCLGPCSLAPVVQVWPEGTLYGGVDETGLDRIIVGHLMGDQVIEDLAYLPLPGKQRLRD